MGICSTLFYNSNDSEKQTLHRRITPSEDQFEEQQERWNNLAGYLIPDLKIRSGYPLQTWLQGSYKFGTQVRPVRKGDEFDIDLGVYFIWEGTADDGDHEPIELKRNVQASLEDYVADDVLEVISPPKPRCSRIRFKGDFHIDIPAYHLDPDRDARMLATEMNSWENSDPKALYLWFVDKFDENLRPKVRRQIRYLKIWALLMFSDNVDRPSSTLLTILVVEAIDELSREELASDDDTLACLLREIVGRLELDRSVPNPAANDYEDLTEHFNDDAFDNFLEKLGEFRDIANAALECVDILSSADMWSKAFEHFFPLPDDEELKKAEIGTRTSLMSYITPDVQVVATHKKYRKQRWVDKNKIGPIPKGCEIMFSIINRQDIPPNVDIQWVVRNEGNEAEEINDLGHIAESGLKASEQSAYKGTHYMDCMIREYGAVVGMRRIPVTISGRSIPRRNPAKRPAWVQLRGRR